MRAGRPTKYGDYHTDIQSVAFDPEGKILAVGAFDGSIKLFNALSGKPHTVLNPPHGPEDDPVAIT